MNTAEKDGAMKEEDSFVLNVKKVNTMTIKYFQPTKEEQEIINKLQFPYSVDFYQGSSFLSCEEDIVLDRLKNRLFNYYFDLE